MAQKAAWINGAGRVIAIDPLEYRLERARQANKVDTLNPHEVDVVETIRSWTDGRGADVCIDAVGFEAERSFFDKVKATINMEKGTMKVLEMCFSAVRRNGTVSILGVYGTPFDNFPLGQMFDKGIKIFQGQAPVVNYIDHLIELVTTEKVILDDVISHRLPLSEVAHGYDIFKNKEDDCVKIVLNPWA
jgi:S-(hydroxymethyl)glutathione dehydrogenase/alcohol dehydrogenase